MHGKRLRALTAVVAATCALTGIAACSSSGGSKSSSSAGAGASSTASAGPASGAASGTAATGSPVKIGFFDPSSGPTASPGVATGEKAAVSYLNQALGGLNGHKIDVVDCAVDGTPETSVSCANSFVSQHVLATVDGYNLASSAALPILTPAKIPMIGMIPFDSVTGAKPDNRVYFGAPQASYLIGALQAFQQEGKKSATLVLVDTPSSHQTIDQVLKPVGAALGIKVTGLYFSATNPNFTALASTIVSSKPDVGGLIASPNDATCTKLVQGLRQLGYHGTVLLAACTGFIKQAPSQAANSALYSSNWLPSASSYAPADAQAELKTASSYIDAVHNGTDDYYAYGTFATFVDLAKGMATAPSVALTGPNVLGTLKALKAFPSFLGPQLTCGKATSPNCTTQMLLFQVQSDGTTKPVSGGFITALASVLAKIPGAS